MYVANAKNIAQSSILTITNRSIISSMFLDDNFMIWLQKMRITPDLMETMPLGLLQHLFIQYLGLRNLPEYVKITPAKRPPGRSNSNLIKPDVSQEDMTSLEHKADQLARGKISTAEIAEFHAYLLKNDKLFFRKPKKTD